MGHGLRIFCVTLTLISFGFFIIQDYVSADCTGTDVSPCDCCDTNAMWVTITAPSGGGDSGPHAMGYQSSSGTCGTTPYVNETWSYVFGFNFCPTEGTYTAVIDASTAGGDQTCSVYDNDTSSSLSLYVMSWDSKEDWCDCRMTATGCGGSSCWNDTHSMPWEAGTSQGCCGDDTGETYIYFMSWSASGIYDNETCDDINDERCVNGGRNASDEACCDDDEDCVYNGACYAQNTYLDLTGDGRTDGWCMTSDSWNGSWRDCDSSSTNCGVSCGTAYVAGGEGSAFGEYDTGSETECCEDDSGEEYAYRTADASMDSGWSTNASDDTCCDNTNDCGTGGTCYASGYTSSDMDGDGDNDYCNAGTWYDCSTNAQCSGGDDCISGDCVDVIDLTYVLPTPGHDTRQTGGSVTINVTVNDTDGNNIDTCWLEWNGANETMNKVGTGTYVTCYATKSISAGSQYTFRVYANDTVGADETENERNFTANTQPSLTGIYLNVSFAKSGDHVRVSTAGASDVDGDPYYLRCGNESGAENLCNSTQGTGERNCTFPGPWEDDSNHMVYCHIDDTYEDSPVRQANITADNTPPTPDPAQISSLVMTSTSATVTAVQASDSGDGLHPLPYRFNDSGIQGSWQASRIYTNSSLSQNTPYCFRVQYRDNLTNTGTESQEMCNYTLADQPTITSVTCAYNGTHYCEANFSMGSNPAGTGYYIEETTGNSGGDDKNWTAWSGENSYEDVVSSPHTQYCYRIKARNQNSTETSYSSQVCNTSYNNLPQVGVPVIYDKDMAEVQSVRAGTYIYVRANVTDADGAPDLSSARITITDNGSNVRVNGDGMTSIASISDGYLYQYQYSVPADGGGVWTIEVTGTDLGNGQGTNSTTLTVIALKLEVRLVLNQTSAKTYIPGEGEKAYADLGNERFTNPGEYYLASYYNNTLYGLIFQNQNPLWLFTNRSSGIFGLGIHLNYPNSILFLLMSKGDWRAVNNRMDMIKRGDFLLYPEPSFSFGLGMKYKMKMLLQYDNTDILGPERKMGKGINPLSMKHEGLIGENIGLNITRKSRK